MNTSMNNNNQVYGNRSRSQRFVRPHMKKKKSEDEWLPNELNNTIKNFNEMFITNLSTSLSHIFVPGKDGEREGDES
jgi:hypothetical protein